MRTVWTMGFVAAAALSFCFPDFIVFRFTQAVIWAIALLGLVLLCGVSGQFSFAQAALFGIGGYSAAIIGAHTPCSVYCGLPAALLVGYAAGYGLGRIAGGQSLWTQALVELRLRHRLPAAPALAPDRAMDRRRAGPLSRLPDAARRHQRRPLEFLHGARPAGGRRVARREHDRQPLRPRADGGARQRSRRRRAGHPRRAGTRHDLGHRRRLSRAGGMPVGLPVRLSSGRPATTSPCRCRCCSAW